MCGHDHLVLQKFSCVCSIQYTMTLSDLAAWDRAITKISPVYSRALDAVIDVVQGDQDVEWDWEEFKIEEKNVPAITTSIIRAVDKQLSLLAAGLKNGATPTQVVDIFEQQKKTIRNTVRSAVLKGAEPYMWSSVWVGWNDIFYAIADAAGEVAQQEFSDYFLSDNYYNNANTKNAKSNNTRIANSTSFGGPVSQPLAPPTSHVPNPCAKPCKSYGDPGKRLTRSSLKAIVEYHCARGSLSSVKEALYDEKRRRAKTIPQVCAFLRSRGLMY
jgi:hypothetical protein